MLETLDKDHNLDMNGNEAVIIDCYDDYDIRLRYVEEAFERCGLKPHIYLSDYNHYKKNREINLYSNAAYIHVMAYKYNISVSRIVSHMQFALKIWGIIRKNKPKVIYCMVPPNCLCAVVSKYEKKSKIIFDVCDMWPETMPYDSRIPGLKAAFKLWKNLRDKNIGKSDFVVSECDLFLKKLPIKEKSKSIYLCKGKKKRKTDSFSNEKINLLYLGSINNIIDIDGITKFLLLLNKEMKVTLEIIGDGESREKFIEKLRMINIRYVYHGIIYDEQKKQAIFDRCSFGINMMKSEVFVGLTMKSIDYFSYSLPVINNIPADTHYLVEKNRIGFNINDKNGSLIVKAIKKMSTADYIEMTDRVSVVFDAYFDEEKVIRDFQGVIGKIMEKK